MSEQTQSGREVLHDADSAAQLLRVRPATIRWWWSIGRLPRVKVGRLTRVRECDVLALLKKGRLPVNPPLSIERYPENTLEGMIARSWVSMILSIEDHTIDYEPIQKVIAESRGLMRECGWPRDYQHNYLNQLRLDITELTRCHPVTRRFVRLLEIELTEL